ncbi:MAG: hypothetical protein SFY56_06050 [Bacteroidota bacterium]|nr:hypothetical protein [Bacteroidota bacterium]
MKKTIMPTALLCLTLLNSSCGGGKKEEKGGDEQKASTEETISNVVKDWKYYRKIAGEFTLDGVKLSNANQSSDAVGLWFYQGWNVQQDTTTGTKNIKINGNSLSRSGSVMELKDFSLDKYKERITKAWNINGTETYDFKEYQKNDVHCYYCKVKKTQDGKIVNQQLIYQYIDPKADVVINGYLEKIETDRDYLKADETVKKVFDYLAK